eukprot:gene4591-4805_t
MELGVAILGGSNIVSAETGLRQEPLWVEAVSCPHVPTAGVSCAPSSVRPGASD